MPKEPDYKNPELTVFLRCTPSKDKKSWKVNAGTWKFEAHSLEDVQKRALEIFPRARFITSGAGSKLE